MQENKQNTQVPLLGYQTEESEIQSYQEKQEETHLIRKHKSTGVIVFHAIIACMGSFFFGFANGELNMALPTLDYKFGIGTDIDITISVSDGMLTSAMPLGSVLGCLLAGEMLNKMSRRSVFYICDFIAIVTCALFIIESFYLAVFLRFVMGIIVGINSAAVPLYLREMSPLSISGAVCIMNQGFLNIGIVVGYLLGLGFPLNASESGDFYWRFVLAFPIITSIIRLIGITFIFRNDTAQFYLSKDNKEMAQKVIKNTYYEEYQEEILEQFETEATKKKETVDTWKLVFSKEYRSRLVTGCMVSFCQQFSGINAIVFYSSTIFENCFGDKQLANYMTLVSGLVLAVFSFASGFFTQKFGRKPIFIVNQYVLIITLVGVGIVSLLAKDQIAAMDVDTSVTVLTISLIFIYDIAFSFGLGPITWAYNADILSSEKSLGFATALNMSFAFTIGLLFPILQEALGIYTMFFIFAGFCVIGLLFFQFMLKETRGKTQKEIIAMFEKPEKK